MQLTDDMILRYVAGEATEEEAFAVDSAMAQDPELFDRVRSLFDLKDHFEEVWASFSLASREPDHVRAQVVEAAVKLAQANPALADRLRRCATEAGAVCTGSFRLFVDRTRQWGGIAATQLAQGLTPRIQFGFCGVGSADQALQRHIEQGSAALVKGNLTEVTRALEAAAGIQPSEVEKAGLKIEQNGQVVLELSLNSLRGTLDVKFWPRTGVLEPTQAILISDSGCDLPIVANFEAAEGDLALIAEFLAVPSTSSHLFLLSNPHE